MTPPKKNTTRGLGRGLSALMSDVDITPSATAPDRDPRTVPIEQIYPNPNQPRRSFDATALAELTASIAEKGIIQPLIVRRNEGPNGSYEIVAGERRWRAAQQASLHDIPIIIKDFTDIEVLEVAIIENIQRSDLTAIDEALGYQQLMEKFDRTQEEMGKALGKSRSHIANTVRLLSLPQSVQSLLSEGRLSAGHARALIGHPDAEALAVQIVKKRLSVREAEKLAKSAKTPRAAPRAVGKVEKDADTIQIEDELSAHLGMRVEISHTPGGDEGQLTVRYKDLSQLDELMRILSTAEF